MILALKKSKKLPYKEREREREETRKNSISTSSFTGKQDLPTQKGQILYPLKKEKKKKRR